VTTVPYRSGSQQRLIMAILAGLLLLLILVAKKSNNLTDADDGADANGHRDIEAQGPGETKTGNSQPIT